MDEHDKTQILLAAADQRYKSIENIRSRVQTTCTWILGAFLLVAGWIVQMDTPLDFPQRLFLVAALIISISILRGFYLRELERGFRSQLRTVAKIEEELGLYETGIYPKDWKKAGAKEGNGSFFFTSYLLLYVGTAILITAILLGSK